MLVEREVGARRELHPASRATPMPGHRRQAADRAHRHRPTGVPLQPVIDADERGTRLSILPRQRHDPLGGDPRDLGDARRRILAHALTQRIGSEGVLREVGIILQPLGEEDVHQPEGERAIGAGTDPDPLVALLRGPRLDRVDTDHRRAPLARLQHEGPEMRIRGEGVRPPENDEIALGYGLDVRPDARPEGHAHPHHPGGRADGAIQERGTDAMEEAPIHRFALEQSHRPRIRIGEDRLRPIGGGDDRVQSCGDRVECRIP